MFLLKSVFLVLNVILLSAKANKVSYRGNVCNKRLQTLILDLAEQFTFGDFIHVVATNDISLCPFSPASKELFTKYQLILTNPKTISEANDILIDHPTFYIVFIPDYQVIHQLVNVITMLQTYTKSWNPGARFLVVITTICPYSRRKFKRIISIFNYLWQQNIFRVVLMLSEDSSKAVSLFSSRPFSETFSTCRSIKSSFQLQTLNLNQNNTSLLQLSGYSFVTPKNFLGCPLVAHTFPFPPYSIYDEGSNFYRKGLEVELILLLAEWYNISASITNIPGYKEYNGWSKILSNGTKIGMIIETLEYKIDFAFAGAIPSPNFTYNCGSAWLYAFNSISWYVPDPSVIPTWKFVIHTFSNFTWFALFFIFVVVILLYYLVSRLMGYEVNESIYLKIIAVGLSFPAVWPGVRYLRLLLLNWSMFSFHVTQMFNTQLFSILTKRPNDPGITTVEGIKEANLRMCTSDLYRNNYMNNTQGAMRKLFEEAVICHHVTEKIEEMLKFRNISIFSKDDNMDFLVDKENANIHQVIEKFFTYPVTMYFTRGSIFGERLNNLVYILAGSGINMKWMKDIKASIKHKFSLKEEYLVKSSTGLLLTGDDFVWAYILLLSGLSIAFVAFMCEMARSPHKRHKPAD